MAGRSVLITGGTGGIGQATAIGLAALGAGVAMSGRDGASHSAGTASQEKPAAEACLKTLVSSGYGRR
jgi:retinol dehydrogenase-14